MAENNYTVESNEIPKIKMSNGREAAQGQGKWMRKNGKWQMVYDSKPKVIHARLIDEDFEDFNPPDTPTMIVKKKDGIDQTYF